jgi:hypothetical protein
MTEDEKPEGQPQAVQYQPIPSSAQVASENSAAAINGAQNVLGSGILPQYAQQMTDIQGSQAPQMAAIYNQIQQQYSPQLVDLAISNLKRADPTGFSLREDLGSRYRSDLALGGSLSPEEERLRSQDLRAAQVSRGVGTGFSDAIDEARYLGNERFNRQQTRQNNAFNFVNGLNPASAANSQAPVSAPNVQGFAQGLFPNTGQLIGAQQGYNQLASNQVSNQNAFNQNAFQFGVENTTNPLKDNISFATGLTGSLVGSAARAYTMCWVAEALYGKDAPKTHRIRSFVKEHLDDNSSFGEFCREYLKKGERWAKEVEWNKDTRQMAKAIWDMIDEMALSEPKQEA